MGCNWDDKMFPKINVVTPCSRPENLNLVADSLLKMNTWSIRKAGKFDVKWWIVFDMNRLGLGDVNKACLNILDDRYHPLSPITLLNQSEGSAGHQHRNLVLSILEETDEQGWFYSVDDDNIMHENFCEIIDELNEENAAVVVNQILKNGEPNRSPVDSRPLKASAENMKTYFVDTAQVIFNLEKIKGMRFDESLYNADGRFIEELFSGDDFVFIDKDLSYYNFLR